MTTVSFCSENHNLNILNEAPFEPTSGQNNIPLFGKPIEIGHFSITADKKIYFDKRNLKYLISPLKTKNLNFNLNHNFDSDVHHQYVTIEKMYQILYWLKFNQQGNLQRSDLFDDRPAIDFVTVRGAIAKIMCTPYGVNRYNKWEICASKLNGVIYFTTIDSDEDIEKNFDPSMKVYQAWGYKFEQYITSDEMGGDADMCNVVHQLEEFNIILKSVLNGHKLLYKAEMDACIPYRRSSLGVGDTSCYTELKTFKILRTPESESYFLRCRAVAWWAQSYIAGVPDIICGNRTDNGFVKYLTFYGVSRIAEDASEYWSKDTCLNFCDKFLTFLKKIVVEDDIKIVYRFQYDGEGKIMCSRLVNPEKRFVVIPDWYVKE